MVCHPVVSLGPGGDLCCSSGLKAWKSCLGSDPDIQSLEVRPGIHTQLYGITLLTSLFSMIHLTISRSLEPPFSDLQTEIGLLVSPLGCILSTAASLSWTKSWEDKEKENNNGDLLCALGITATLVRGKSFALSEI